MKRIRNRYELANCALLVVRTAERKIDQIRSSARSRKGGMSDGERITVNELKKVVEEYRAQAAHHVLIAGVCGEQVMTIRSL